MAIQRASALEIRAEGVFPTDRMLMVSPFLSCGTVATLTSAGSRVKEYEGRPIGSHFYVGNGASFQRGIAEANFDADLAVMFARRFAGRNNRVTLEEPSCAIVPIALRAKADDKIGLLVPKDNAAEAAVVKGQLELWGKNEDEMACMGF